MGAESALPPIPDTDRAFGAIHGNWIDTAECSGENDLFYANGKEPNAARLAREGAAAAICLRCPVINVCLANAPDSRETEGVWAATNPRERKNALAKAAVELARGREDGQKASADEVNRRAFNLLYDQRPGTATGAQ